MPNEEEKYVPDPTITINGEIRYHANLTSGEKLFYAELDAMYQKTRKPCSCKVIREIMNVSHQTLINWIDKLVQLDLIDVHPSLKKREGMSLTIKNK